MHAGMGQAYQVNFIKECAVSMSMYICGDWWMCFYMS